MNLQVLTLGERMVMIARIAAAEHIRQAAKGEGVEIAQIGRLIQDAKLQSGAKPLGNATLSSGDARVANDPAENSMRNVAQRGPGEAA